MLTIKQLNTKIKSVSKRTATLRADIQTILINAAGHAYQHRDVGFFTRLFAATSGMNRKLIAKWAQEYGFAALQKDGSFKLNKTAHKDADFADGEAVVAYLTENARDWFADEENASEIIQTLDVARLIELLATRIQNAGSPNSSKKVNVVFDTAKTASALEKLRASIQDKATDASNAQAAQDRANWMAMQREADAEEAAEAALDGAILGIAAE